MAAAREVCQQLHHTIRRHLRGNRARLTRCTVTAHMSAGDAESDIAAELSVLERFAQPSFA
jgi:hypothetical protein